MTDSTMADPPGNYTISSVQKAMHILQVLAFGESSASLAELSRAAGMPKPTVFRYLSTLEQLGYVRKDVHTGLYELGLRLFELGSKAIAKHTLREVALSEMHSLLDRFSETVNLAIMDAGQVLYLEILDSPQAMRMSARVGSRDCAHATSLGKAMLAFLPEEEVEQIARTVGFPSRTQRTIATLAELEEELARVRALGYAVDTGENEVTARCVGAPVFDRFGDVAGAISLSGPSHRFSEDQVEAAGKALVEAADRISQRMRYSGS